MPRHPHPASLGNLGPNEMPKRHPGGGCWTCTHWLSEFLAGGAHIVCHNKWGPLVKCAADRGCAFWEREPGADDEIVYRTERMARGWLAPEFSAPGKPKRREGR